MQVADVKKTLAAAMKICKAGNKIVLDEEESECYIMNKTTKEKTQVEEIDGVNVFDVWLDDPSHGKSGHEDFDPVDDAEYSEQEGVMETGFSRLAEWP